MYGEFNTESEYDQSVLWELERKRQIDENIAAIKERLKELRARFNAAKERDG